MSEFKKHDQAKTQLAFLPFKEVEMVASVMDFGAAKYGRNNWKNGCSFLRLASAALRHIFAWIGGESKDAESGLPHLAHAACCLLFLMWYEGNSMGEDDRGHLPPKI